MSLVLTGIGVTSGIAIGQVHRLTPGELSLPEYHLDADAVDAELERIRRALDRSQRFLGKLLERMVDSGDTARELLESHRLILRDPLLVDATCDRIRSEKINAEWALVKQTEQLVAEFKRIDNDYIALRREDLEQAVNLVQRELADQPSTLIGAQVPHQLGRTIVVAPELGPADMAVLNQRRVAGLVTEHGGPLSHSAILARSLEIPMIVGLHHALDVLEEGEAVILDGHYGALLAAHDESLLRHYEDKREVSLRRRADLRRYLGRPSRTLDGTNFRLFGNAELPEEFQRCRDAGVAGIGLMRTEYLFMGDQVPDEETQYRAYRAAVEVMDGRPLTVRTLDAGGDKLPPALAVTQGPNPALGLRGLRLSLAVSDLFRQQLRAILRASVFGPIQILLPMITSIEEVRQARHLIESCRQSLIGEDLAIDPNLPVGGMIETPAAALTVEQLARELDFLSIGTNDLSQYVLAIDRQDELVSYLYDPTHRSILGLIAGIVASGRDQKLPVTVCGELAGDERAARLLLGLGVTDFSMPPASLPAVKKSLIEADAGRCRKLVEAFLREDGDEQSGQSLLEALNRPAE
ncbi:MAG: phosphoenolpyruvate--protein phosphotransferase [Wenzhouxiangella sp.]|nr:phosphoenolpyruvate--protein phosphotransferase [Wenzhouxiangella sp.]TVR93444.1 MAG: phosphoenolpyruvate--protein phosphotransferase [Wenzhouxiangellaceae bacterium]